MYVTNKSKQKSGRHSHFDMWQEQVITNVHVQDRSFHLISEVNIVLQTNCLKDCLLEKLLGDLSEQTKFHNLVIRLKKEALKVLVLQRGVLRLKGYFVWYGREK